MNHNVLRITCWGDIIQLLPFINNLYIFLTSYSQHNPKGVVMSLSSLQPWCLPRWPPYWTFVCFSPTLASLFCCDPIPFMLFSTIAHDIHTISLPFIVHMAFEFLSILYSKINLLIQPHKFATWSPSNLLNDLSLPPYLPLPLRVSKFWVFQWDLFHWEFFIKRPEECIFYFSRWVAFK